MNKFFKLFPKYAPDPFWTFDFHDMDGMLDVIEINSFACAGLYDLDTDIIVGAIEECV